MFRMKRSKHSHQLNLVPKFVLRNTLLAAAAVMPFSAAVGQTEGVPTTLPKVVVVDEKEKSPLQQAAGSASRLNLSVRETPASIEVLPRSLLTERGVRSVSESAQAATGVTAGDFPAEPSNFSMQIGRAHV